MNKDKDLDRWLREYGPEWTALYIFRSEILALLGRIDKKLIAIEKREFLTGEEAISSQYHTLEMNRRLWDAWNWSYYGEEWTLGVKVLKGLDPSFWKTTLISRMMLKYIKKGSKILEVGPGAGRWTEHLQIIASRLVIADISEKCLDICKGRFRKHSNIEYYLIKDQGLDLIADDIIDYVWSYDVFVHINPRDVERYIVDFQRILQPGGYAIIHHPGKYPSEEYASRGFRSYIDGEFFAHLVAKHGLEMVEQDDSLVHYPGDLISVFRKPI